MPAKRKPAKRKKPEIEAMIVRRETRADMASAWVRELAKQEIRQMLAPLRLEMNHAVLDLKRAIAEVVISEEKLQAQMKDLERRAGDFTGLSESQVSKIVSARVTAQVTRRTIDEMFRDVIGRFYGASDHPSFRKRFRLDDEALCQGSD